MSRYTELKEEIEAVDEHTGVKEFDDLLREVRGTYTVVNLRWFDGSGKITIYKETELDRSSIDIDEGIVSWELPTDQCGMGRKQIDVLLWLLDHSKIKNEKQEEIDKLKDKMEKIKVRIEYLES